MKMVVPCAICMTERPEGSNSSGMIVTEGEFDAEGRVHTRCSQGHVTIVGFNARRYEILLRSAAKAFIAGFANETISSLSAALERCHEYYIRIACRARSIDMVDTWKLVSSQSERQLGAFIFVHLLVEGTCLPLHPDIARIRNSVVHRGELANQELASKFGELVFERIRDIERSLEKMDVAVTEENLAEMHRLESNATKDVPYATLKVTGVIAKGSKVTGRIETFAHFTEAVRSGIAKGLQ